MMLHDDDDDLRPTRERGERANERDARKESLGASPASRGWVLRESGEERGRLEKLPQKALTHTFWKTENDEEKNATTRTNVEPSRARNDEENTVLLPRHGKDGARSASERSRCARALSRSFRSRTFWVFSPTLCCAFLCN